jgi:hypothetical protein
MSKKAEITFVDTSAEVKKTMAGLAKSALRASAKVIRKHVRDDVPTRTKHIKNHVASWVFVDRDTGQPKLQVGFYGWQRVKKRGKQPSHSSPWWIERGTKPHAILTTDGIMYDKSTGTSYGNAVNHPGQQATNVLRNAVYNNISEIKAAQEEYLKLLNEEIKNITGKTLDGEAEDDD